jgi:uncharacterized protein (DUF58 family)
VVNPLFYLLLSVIPLAVLARWRRAYPSRKLVLLALGPAIAAFLLLLWSPLWQLVLAVDLAALIFALADLVTIPGAKAFAIERQALRIASLQKPHRVTLTVLNRSELEYSASLRDGYPATFTAAPPEFDLQLQPRSRSTMHYDLMASRRGAFTLQTAHLRVESRFGLWVRYFVYPVESVIHVYPDMKQLAEYAVLARTNRLSLMGVRRTRRVGQDNEFERLRDYTRDDNFKHIHWRSTARRSKLTVKDFQTNQSQRIVFLIDCGRMMTNEAAGLSLLDHALNAMLMMSYVALRQGDSVGLLCFSDEIHGFVPPRGGMRQMNQLLHASFDRFPRLVESRYDEAFLYLAARSRKRALVVLVTNVIDEVNSRQIEQYLQSFVGRHLPLAVLLRDRVLFDAADRQLASEEELFRAAAAADILTWRHQVLADLSAKGVLSLDVFPEEMTAPLVNQYLDIKARHLL